MSGLTRRQALVGSAGAVVGAAGTISANGITATLYTVNQDADAWHYLLLWRKFGNLYTLSEHVAPPLTGQHVKQYLKRELASLTLIRPA